MKYIIFKHPRSIKTRILSAFLAMLIFSLMFASLFENLGFNKADAALGSEIKDDTRNSTYMVANTVSEDTNYTYSGKMKTNPVTLFDYVTNNEVEGSDINLGVGSDGYHDPYGYFNEAISEGSVTSSYNENITFVLENAGTGDKWIYLWDDSGDHGVHWPGQKMREVGDNKYVITISTTVMGFTPSHVKFAKFSNNSYSETVSSRSGYDNQNGYTNSPEGYSAGSKYYFWANNNASGISKVSNAAENIYNGVCQYTNPLYFGMFYISNEASSYDAAAINNTATAKNYKNFHWLSNMGLKSISGQDYNYRGPASVQKLVDNKLTNSSNLNKPVSDGALRQNNIELPYFSENWADNHDTLMRYYNKNNDGDSISFPFYEVKTPLSGASTNSNVKLLDSINHPAQSGDYAKYYQFNSHDSNLYFNKVGSDSDHTGYFTESDTKIYSSAPTSTVGFFPFDMDNHNNDHTKNNLGFGTKFEMNFTLQEDGCVSVVDSNGKERDPTDYPERVHTTFEFQGDDDLWVFIDGHLVLDMGGDHNQSYGIIDFCTGKATVAKAAQYTDGNQNNLGVAIELNKEYDFKSATYTDPDDNIVKPIISGYDAGTGKYDSSAHVMTIFYMERGMADSNLLIRYNYTTLSNFSKMKIQEITKFDPVNAGLLDLTKKAAENDVFKYTAYNTGTRNDDVKTPSKMYPENEIRTRTNQTISTILTTQHAATSTEYNYVPPASSTTEGIVKNTSYIWVDDFANMNHDTQGTGLTAPDPVNSGDHSAGSFFLMYGTEKNTTTNTVEMESSAEFGKQFSRYSSMRVNQIGDDKNAGTTDELYLYKPVRNGGNAVTFQTTEGTSSPRKITDYYTSDAYIWSTSHTSPYNLSSINDSFIFRNEIGSVSSSDSTELIPVQMTETFTNTVRTGEITISKSVDGESTNAECFQFKLTLTNVFGVTDNNVGNNDYGSIEISNAFNSTGSGISTLAADGTFYVKPGTTASITGIPYGTHYELTETPGDSFNQTSMSNISGDITGSDTIVKAATVVNTRLTGNLVLKKTLGTNAAAHGVTDGATFTFNVTLTLPASVSSASYTIGGASTAISSGTQFTVSVPAGSTGVTLSGIPRGTTYTVTEDTTGLTLDGSPVVVNGTGTITTTPSTVTITNNYPAVQDPVSLDIEKVDADNKGTKLENAVFDLYYVPEGSGTPASSTPVLSNESAVTYNWTEDTTDPNYNYIRFADIYEWNNKNGNPLIAHFHGGSSTVDVQAETETETYSGKTVYKFSLENIGDNTQVLFTNRKTYNTNSWSDGHMTENLVLATYGGGHGYAIKPTTDIASNNGSTKSGFEVYEPSATITGTYQDGFMRFDNSLLGWSTVYAYVWNSANESQKNDNYPGEQMTSESNGIYKYDMTSYSYADRVIFNAGSGNAQTQNLTLDDSNNYGKNAIFHASAGSYFYVDTNTYWNNTNNYAVYIVYNGDDYTDSNKRTQMTDFNGDGFKGRKWVLDTNKTSFILAYEQGGNWSTTKTYYISDLVNNGIGSLYQVRYSNNQQAYVLDYKGIYNESNNSGYWESPTVTWPTLTSGTTTTCTATYQPEDRYDDANNFIYITGVSDPHVKFFTSTDGTGTVIGGTDANTYGIKLTTAESSGTYSGYYKIRLPKNAASFTVNDESAITLNDDAGSRFTVDASGTVTNTIKRTTTPKPALTTDSFVSFRDVNNTWDSTVFAYFFGGTNGEYSEWQGVSPFKSYKDGSDTVYVFQYPSGGTTNYPKVIFNSGAYSANNNKRTDAITYAAGNIYQSTAARAEYTPSTDADSNWVKLATVQTNSNGRIGSVTDVKNSNSDIDGEYIANTSAELSDSPIYIKVKKLGTYVWKETSAPPNYELAHDKVIIVTESQRGTTVKTQIEDHMIPVGSTNEIILTKTAKEKTNSANIGEALSDAKFQLIKIDGNSIDDTLRFSKDSSTTDTNRYTYNASSGTYNVTGFWLTTGTDGVLHLKNLPVGDYYLEEQYAPANYSKKDSNEVSGGVVKNRKVYFSVGNNTTTKEITCSDEMTPAYIKLYEHINDKKEAWGNPTFIFNIRNTDPGGKTIRVALTVNDNDKRTDGLTTHPTLSYDYSSWYEESTVESEYHGMYHIDNQGRIRVEPGTYEITRVPVSRYEFVEKTWKLSTTGDYQTNRDGTTEQLTINVPADDTATVHYYDKVAYYDKFTHVDTRINSFYQLDSSTKANRTVKGIRVMDYSVPGSTGSLNLTGSALTVYKVYVDGTEALMDSTEKSEITFSVGTSGDNSGFTTPVLSGDSKTLTVSDVSSYTNNVYTLTATYSGFTDSFDLVFART